MPYNITRPDALKTPPSITGEEVSARWKRTYIGEVIMTVRCPMIQWTQRSTLRLPKDIQASRWTMDVLNLEEELGPHSNSPQGDQGQVDKVQKGEDPEHISSTQDCWKTPDEEPQMLVPQTK